jgi:hypothetical protein
LSLRRPNNHAAVLNQSKLDETGQFTSAILKLRRVMLVEGDSVCHGRVGHLLQIAPLAHAQERP